ncbi:MAG: DNA translocase FtsK, partial [Clostridia bacterium]|nr:DNA translocase FtsK [Clostridia bacterium]
YNGIPHLLVPVVSDSKKAAGALNWAVIEMERRFILLEELGVRDIKGYNEAVKNDPDHHHMSHIVIIIDELADLMMTAKNEVETSICRLAQKARAAGMHLVIGTQRPSVDVITGLIKANVPSRIACTVASQVDSRTIIDIIGAEKLLGKGDMLYAPVGSSKPLRVQGCFVSDAEVEAVCDFIRAQRAASYDEAVSNLIEREAQKCGEKKKGFGGFDDEDGPAPGSVGLFHDKDPLLEKAIDIAVSEKKVSTSLLQRKLSVGYARAAKLIDFMAEMNVVGEYAGSKPREVLWTEQYYAEYKMRALEDQPID